MEHEVANGFHRSVTINQQSLVSNLKAEYDVIVCGTGTAGSVIAGRLGADPHLQILVLEAGGSDVSPLIENPNRWPMTIGSVYDWGFVGQANSNLNNRAIPYSMGKVLGGGSSINVSTWSRGHRADWDHYAAETGDPVWSYESILELYRTKIENWFGEPDPTYRGSTGVVHVQPAQGIHPFSTALLEGAATVGLPHFENSNGRMMEAARGSSIVDETVDGGQRKSIFRSYLYPKMGQKNVTVLTNALVTKLVIEDGCAVGIEFLHHDTMVRVRSRREVVVAAGAIQTPKLLMQSGIGNPDDLAKLDIPVVQELSGVGRNLHDHVAFGAIWEIAGDPLPPVPRTETACFWKSDDHLDSPNFYAYARRGAAVSAENAKRHNPPAASWSLSVGMKPVSRGRILLTGANASDPLRIDTGYLSDSRDLDSLVKGLEMVRAIGNSQALAPFRGAEVLPGSLKGADLEQFFRDGLTTFWHQSGTAKMGRGEDAVVDGKLRVHGISGLRVADTSVLPRVTTGNTMAPAVVIGERAAEFIQSA